MNPCKVSYNIFKCITIESRQPQNVGTLVGIVVANASPMPKSMPHIVGTCVYSYREIVMAHQLLMQEPCQDKTMIRLAQELHMQESCQVWEGGTWF